MDEARVKSCIWTTETATHWSPTAAYHPGDIVKIGQYLATGRTGGAYDMGIWVVVRHGAVLTKASNGSALTGVNWSTGSPAVASITGTRINLRTIGHNPPASGAALAAAYAAIADGTAGFNLSDLSIAVSAQWAAGGSLPDTSTFSKDDLEGANSYYVCGRDIAANSLNSPESIGAYGEHPLSPNYWQLLPTYTAGALRTDCPAENDYDAIFCGRCGRPLERND